MNLILLIRITISFDYDWCRKNQVVIENSTIEWHFNKLKLESSAKRKMIRQNHKSTLIILNVNEEDDGEYEIRLVGRNERHIATLRLEGKNSFIYLKNCNH